MRNNYLPQKLLILLLLNYLDGLITLHFITKYGQEVEQNPSMVWMFNHFGVEAVILGKVIGLTIFGILMLLSSKKKELESKIAHLILNPVLFIYMALCILHTVNLIQH